MSIKKIAILFLLFCFQIVVSQNKIPDSLKSYSFEELKELFFENEYTFDVSNIYAKSYLTKSKIAKDTFRIAQGYKYLSYVNPDSLAVKYVDSIIMITKDYDNHLYPAFGYFIKGSWLCNLGKEKEGFQTYLIAKEYAIKQNNSQILNDINQSIASLKLDWGEYAEALTIFENYYNKIKADENYLEKYKDDYLILLHNLGIAYTRNENYLKAKKIINEGIGESIRIKDKDWKGQFIFNLSTNQYFEKNYQDALKNLEASEEFLEGVSLGINYYYQASIYEINDNQKKSILYYKKVDSIYVSNKESYSELRDVYSSLSNYSKSINDSNKQYEYVNKLLQVDSLLDAREQDLKTDIVFHYDIPELKNERNTLKNEIDTQKQKSKLMLTLFISLLFILVLIIIYFYKRNKTYKKRFILILENKNKIKNEKTEPVINANTDLKISKEVINEVLQKLDKFELNKKYTKPGITLNTLSKELKTNSAYLSKIINHYKGGSFSKYLNKLRIENIIEELKNNYKLHSYTIKAIAEEAGFNNAESFSKAFLKETGIYPSYFVKELRKTINKKSLNL